MPDKVGRLSPYEARIADALTGDPRTMDIAARIGQSPANVSRALARPGVQAEIVRLQTERLFREGLPAAVNCLLEITGNPKAPAGARVMAAKVLLDRTLGADGRIDGKEPHEMTGEELAAAIAKLSAVASDRAVNVTPDPAPKAPSAPKPGLFD